MRKIGIFSKFTKKNIKDEYRSPSYNYMFGGTKANKRVDDRSAMQHIAVYACIRVISEGMAQLPLQVYQRTANGKEKAIEHPLYNILHYEPNNEMTSFVFRETLMSHLLTYGNAYAQIIRNSRNEIVGLYPLFPNNMEVNRDSQGNIIYKYSKYDDSSPELRKTGEFILSKKEVLHIPGLGFDGLVGYSPIAIAKNAIGISLACEEYGATFFANGASPSGVLEHPGTIKDPERVRNAWRSAYGSGNSHKTAILEEGMKYTPISIPNNEAQFLETREYQLEEIARLYRVPLHMIGDLNHATYSNIEQQSLEFVKYTLGPWLVRWEQSIHQSLFNEDEKKKLIVKFNVDGLLRGDFATRQSGYATARQNGWLSTNDIREMEDMNLVPDEEGGNLYLVNGSFTKLKDAGAFANSGTDTGIETENASDSLEDVAKKENKNSITATEKPKRGRPRKVKEGENDG